MITIIEARAIAIIGSPTLLSEKAAHAISGKHTRACFAWLLSLRGNPRDLSSGQQDCGTARSKGQAIPTGLSISEYFKVFGYTSSGIWEEFVVGEDYEAFLVTKKNNHFEP